MALVTMSELLDAGVHFGHKTQRWNPKMARFIFGVRNEIHIFDLQHTVRGLHEATDFLSGVVRNGGRVIYVGTKRQAKDTIKICAEESGQFYVTERWLGGILTNFQTIKTRLQRLRELRSRAEAGEFASLSKRDEHTLNVEMVRLERKMGGIANMTGLPEALVVVDPRREQIAVHEAKVLGIPVVALTDSNCDPDEVDIIIPGNDDSIRSIRLVLGLISSTVTEAFESHEAERIEREQIERAERERLERVRREMALKQQEGSRSVKTTTGTSVKSRGTASPRDPSTTDTKSKAATKATSKAATKATSKATSKAATKATSKAATKATSKAATKATSKAATKATTKAATKATSKAATKATSKAGTKAMSTKPATNTPGKSSSKSKTAPTSSKSRSSREETAADSPEEGI